MQKKRRTFLKTIGLFSLAGLGSYGVWQTTQTGLLTPKPKGKKQLLITDPPGEKFIYDNGFIVLVEEV